MPEGIVPFTLTFLSCTSNLSDNEKLAKEDIENRGYTFVESKGEVEKYVLDKRKISGGTETVPYQQIWSIQNIDLDKYFGKEIIVYEYIVKNHPLQDKNKNAKDGVKLYYMIADGEIIGGYTHTNSDIVGECSAIDGKSLEEVIGLSYSKWSEEWNFKYSDK